MKQCDGALLLLLLLSSTISVSRHPPPTTNPLTSGAARVGERTRLGNFLLGLHVTRVSIIPIDHKSDARRGICSCELMRITTDDQRISTCHLLLGLVRPTVSM